MMPAKNPDLHGNVPDKAPVALVLIDVINDLEFPEGDQLARPSEDIDLEELKTKPGG